MSSTPRFNFFKLVRRNLSSRPYYTMIIILIFSLIAATLFSAQYLASGAAESLNRGTRMFGADLVVVPAESTAAGEESLLNGNPAMFFFSDGGFENISRIPGVAKVSPEILVSTLAGVSCCSDYLQIIALDPEKDFTLSLWLKNNPNVILGKDAIIVGSRIDGEIGSDLLFYGHTFHIVGKLEATGMRGVDKAVFIRMDDAYAMADESGSKAAEPLVLPRGMVSSVLVQLERGASPVVVGDAILSEVPGTRVLTRDSLSGTVTRNLAGITRFLYYIAIVLTAVFLPVLIFVSIMLAREMKQEITFLGALGATKAFLVRLILAETFSSSVIGSLAGIGAALIVLIGFQDVIALSLEIPFSIPAPQDIIFATVITLIITLMISAIASIYPTVRLLRSEVYSKTDADDSG
ncbi:MAG: FtsX-like permease family protein [Methanoregula sp.]|nr:FtsX-like permease family protein [Methanoregula sp.]